MNTLLLLVLLALLGGPHALHTGARDPSIRENLVAAAGVRSGRRWQLGAAGGGQGRAPSSPGCTLSRASTPTSTRQVNGDWFSIAQASDEPKLLRKDADMFLVHKIHISLKTIEFRAEGARRRQGPGEPHALSPVGLTATSQTLEGAGDTVTQGRAGAHWPGTGHMSYMQRGQDPPSPTEGLRGHVFWTRGPKESPHLLPGYRVHVPIIMMTNKKEISVRAEM